MVIALSQQVQGCLAHKNPPPPPRTRNMSALNRVRLLNHLGTLTGHAKRCKIGASYFDPLDPDKRFRR